MARNDEPLQLRVASELSTNAHALARAADELAAPFDSYVLLGELTATVDDLEQVCRQLAVWHHGVIDGVQYAGEDERGDGATGTVTAAAELDQAAAALDAASVALRAAHAANGVVRWYGDTSE